ncbi:hypothetical protein ACTXT7_006914 [Hymenolepis weldensis]
MQNKDDSNSAYVLSRDELFPQVVSNSSIVPIKTKVYISPDSLTVIWDKNCYQSSGVLISQHRQHDDNLSRNYSESGICQKNGKQNTMLICTHVYACVWVDNDDPITDNDGGIPVQVETATLRCHSCFCNSQLTETQAARKVKPHTTASRQTETVSHFCCSLAISQLPLIRALVRLCDLACVHVLGGVCEQTRWQPMTTRHVLRGSYADVNAPRPG